MQIKIKKLHDQACTPKYATYGDAGADLVSVETISIPPKKSAMIPTGIAVEIPAGYVGLIHPRSGLAAKYGVTVLNAPGTIDAGYRGEIIVILVNHSDAPYFVSVGERIAQLVIQKVEQANFIEVDELSDSVRGEGGFGSTGADILDLDNQALKAQVKVLKAKLAGDLGACYFCNGTGLLESDEDCPCVNKMCTCQYCK